MSETKYFERNKELMLNRAKKWYQNNKEVLREKERNKYRRLSNEQKNVTTNMEEIDRKICLKKINKD